MTSASSSAVALVNAAIELDATGEPQRGRRNARDSGVHETRLAGQRIVFLDRAANCGHCYRHPSRPSPTPTATSPGYTFLGQPPLP